MQLVKSFFTISLVTIFVVSCSSVQVTEESVRESSIATVEVSTSDTYETKSTAISTSATIYFDFDNFLKKNSSLKIDKETSFNKLITNSKITIYNDFSTGFVYGLNMNLPSVIFLPLDLKFIHEENKKDFNKLIENQMIFTSVEKLKDYLIKKS